MVASLAIISGGTSTNELVNMFSNISDNVSYILPISDNGGSTSELLRVIGGPAIGDIRSRITRLIPDDSAFLRNLLAYRLPANPAEAKVEWNSIVEGNHKIWDPVDAPKKEIVRAFLIHVHTELLKRSRNSTKDFRLELASVGNMFLTGARLFCGSLDSAIELVLSLARVSPGTRVLPCLNTNFTYHISALLKNGSIVTGQSQISHPTSDTGAATINSCDVLSPPKALFISPVGEYASVESPKALVTNSLGLGLGFPHDNVNESLLYSKLMDLEVSDTELIHSHNGTNNSESEEEGEYATPAYTHPDLKKSQLHFNKDDSIPLPSAISKIFYISPYGEEIFPAGHPRVLKCLGAADVVIYSIGSLMTSIVPVLILQGVGEAIMKEESQIPKKKVLLLNGSLDRETSWLDAGGFLETIASSLRYSMTAQKKRRASSVPNQGQRDPANLRVSSFVTHLVHLEPSENIPVDKARIESLGVKCVGVRNEKNYNDRYDLDDLERKIKALIDDHV
ncbi:unnamed protein product [Kuraishia capsulata CBS 1993]|uniref:Uncharacterized protein n=1 Tax=Kuraishia capsulata CBS 1993 TaxID=1382522 RepID=W6MJK4_9ASCO|nr:uncharacterized protein KUCA_T00000598001 [Kuraishia capsulata CBS 1993]CDK24632.1 unnamed protein product [Kuraishia capsulata CBS 1993]